MPSYHQVLLFRSCSPPSEIIGLLKSQVELISRVGGVVRGFENHGIRPLADKTRLKYVPQEGNRVEWEAYYISCHFHMSARRLPALENNFKSSNNFLRSHVFRQPSPFDHIHANNFKNMFKNVTPNALLK